MLGSNNKATKRVSKAQAPHFTRLSHMSQSNRNHCKNFTVCNVGGGGISIIAQCTRHVRPTRAFTLLPSSDDCQPINSRPDTTLNNNATYNLRPSVIVISKRLYQASWACASLQHVLRICAQELPSNTSHITIMAI